MSEKFYKITVGNLKKIISEVSDDMTEAGPPPLPAESPLPGSGEETFAQVFKDAVPFVLDRNVNSEAVEDFVGVVKDSLNDGSTENMYFLARLEDVDEEAQKIADEWMKDPEIIQSLRNTLIDLALAGLRKTFQ